jgi:hypothetical protein
MLLTQAVSLPPAIENRHSLISLLQQYATTTPVDAAAAADAVTVMAAAAGALMLLQFDVVAAPQTAPQSHTLPHGGVHAYAVAPPAAQCAHAAAVVPPCCSCSLLQRLLTQLTQLHKPIRYAMAVPMLLLLLLLLQMLRWSVSSCCGCLLLQQLLK